METNRDTLHASGGSFFAAQNSKAAPTVEDKPQVASKVKREPRAVLDLKEDYLLTNWLHERTPKRGETHVDVFREAEDHFADDPIINKLNADHIGTRMKAFASSLPRPADEPKTPEQRLIDLEQVVSVIARGVMSGSYNMADRARIADFLSGLRL